MCIFTDPKHKTNAKVPIYCTETQSKQKSALLLHLNTKQSKSALFTALKQKSKHKVHYLLQVETQKQSTSTLFTPRRNTKTTKKCTIYCIQKHKTNKLITY